MDRARNRQAKCRRKDSPGGLEELAVRIDLHGDWRSPPVVDRPGNPHALANCPEIAHGGDKKMNKASGSERNASFTKTSRFMVLSRKISIKTEPESSRVSALDD